MLKQAVRSIGVILRYARLPTAFTLLLRLAQSFETPLIVFFTANLINSIGAYIGHTGTISGPVLWTALLLAVMLISANSGLFLGLCEIFTQRALNRNFIRVVLGKFRRLNYSCFEDQDVLNTLERMGTEPHMRIYYLYNNTVTAFSTLLSLTGTALVFLQVSVWFAVVYFLLLAPLLWFDYKSIEVRQRLWNTEMPNWRRRTYLSSLMADKHSEFELRIFGALDFILKKWKHVAETFRCEYVHSRLKASRYGVFHVLILAAWAIFVILSMIFNLSAGTVSIGLFVACITSMGAILSGSSAMSDSFSQVSRDCLEMKHYDIFMSLPEIAPDSCQAPVMTPHIIFDNVCFSYPNSVSPVLRGVSFEIHPGERIALVGKNGAGKSTIVKLLCGLYCPASGEIYIDGRPIAQLSQTQLRGVFSAVFQDFGSYELTLRENVAFGDICKINDDTVLKKALKKSLWTEDLSLDTNLGKLEDDGKDLSGGQWQRIATARAMLSSSAFIILDEPTAALDPLAECRMYESFQSALQMRGCVMISHRLASARLADKIIVLDGGIVTQMGKHDELMLRSGLYRDMFTAQSVWYTGDAYG